MRRLTSRVPNVALACPVELAEERSVAPSRRTIRIDVPPGARLGELEWLTGPDGSRWRIETVSETVAYAHEVDADALPPSASEC